MKVSEFFNKWKQGIMAITPFQAIKISIIGNLFIVLGIISGLITTFIMKTRWLFIILLGSFILVIIGFLQIIQKFIILKELEINERRFEDEQKSTI